MSVSTSDTKNGLEKVGLEALKDDLKDPECHRKPEGFRKATHVGWIGSFRVLPKVFPMNADQTLIPLHAKKGGGMSLGDFRERLVTSVNMMRRS